VTPPALEIADLIRTAGAAFVERNRRWIRWKHVRVLLAIARCRTAALGGHLDECTRCAHRAPIKFLRRFLLHVLPQGLVRIRHFGFLACRRRSTTLPLCFQLLGVAQEALTEELTSSTEDVPDLYRCPKRGGPMKVIERLTAAEIQLRSPPRIGSAA
jgi:Putative transposase